MEALKGTKALFFGRTLRFCFGLFFLSEVYPVYRDVEFAGVMERAGVAVGLLAFYVLLHLTVSRFAPKMNPLLGAVLAFAPLLIVFFWGYGGPAATGALTFLAVTLLVAAVRGDPGCEVMSIPAAFTEKHTHLVCLFFSPIDWCERKVVKR